MGSPEYSPHRRRDRSERDEEPLVEIGPGACGGYGVHAARKVWRRLHRNGVAVARWTVERLVPADGLARMVRGKSAAPPCRPNSPPARATWSSATSPTGAPNRRWVTDIAYVATRSGVVYLAFVTDLTRYTRADLDAAAVAAERSPAETLKPPTLGFGVATIS